MGEKVVNRETILARTNVVAITVGQWSIARLLGWLVDKRIMTSCSIRRMLCRGTISPDREEINLVTVSVEALTGLDRASHEEIVRCGQVLGWHPLSFEEILLFCLSWSKYYWDCQVFFAAVPLSFGIWPWRHRVILELYTNEHGRSRLLLTSVGNKHRFLAGHRFLFRLPDRAEAAQTALMAWGVVDKQPVSGGGGVLEQFLAANNQLLRWVGPTGQCPK